MRLPSYDRTDLLVTKGLLCLVALGAFVSSVGIPILVWVSGGALRRELDGLGSTAVPDGLSARDGVSVTGAGSLVVRVADAGTGTWLAALLPGVLLTVAVGVAAWLLLRLLRHIEQGKPFVSASATALRLLGTVILLGSVGVAVGNGIADAVVTHSAFSGAGASFNLHFTAFALVGALLAFALSEAFAQGTRLADDVAGLV